MICMNVCMYVRRSQFVFPDNMIRIPSMLCFVMLSTGIHTFIFVQQSLEPCPIYEAFIPKLQLNKGFKYTKKMNLSTDSLYLWDYVMVSNTIFDLILRIRGTKSDVEPG